MRVGGFPNLYAGVMEQTLFRKATRVWFAATTRLSALKCRSMNSSEPPCRGLLAPLGHIHQEVEKRLMELCPPNHVRVIAESFLLSALVVEKTDLSSRCPVRHLSFLAIVSARCAWSNPHRTPGV